MSPGSSKVTFFRQSGWMMLATLVGGALMYAVHKVAGRMPKAEYGVFATMLQMLTLMTIPSIGLQTVVMRQTVAALTDPLTRQLSRAIRHLLLSTFLIWVLAMTLLGFWHGDLVRSFKVSNPATIWLTAGWGLWILWLPIFVGILQGRQNFLWMGWVSILGGLTRFVAIGVIVLWLYGQAAGACLGVLIQVTVAGLLAGWLTRETWMAPGQSVAWGDWGGRVVPLTLGPGVITYMMSLDMIVVQYYFPEILTGYYAAAGMIGRALVFLTAPMTVVMFPKVAASASRSEKSNAALLALGATGLIGGGAALLCTVLPSLPLRIIYDSSYLRIAWLVPWFAWCMLPLTLGSVLVNNLLARERYRMVVWLVVVALGYAGTLVVVCKRQSSPLLSPASLVNLPSLASNLQTGSTELSRFLRSRLSPDTLRWLEQRNSPAEASAPLAAALAQDLNRIIEGGSIYKESRFAGVAVSGTLREFIRQNTRPNAWPAVNRLLLEEAYPAEIAPMSRGFLHVVQTLGVFGLVLVAVSLRFTLWGGTHKPVQTMPAVPPPE
jgi:O-antigen/teichoic acid export membrane protein